MTVTVIPSTRPPEPRHVEVESRQEVRGVRPPAVSAGTVSPSPSSGGSDAVSSEPLESYFEPGAGPIPAHMFGALTPETILGMVRRQVRTMDQQVQSLVSGIEERSQQARDVQQRLEILQEVMSHAVQDGDESKIRREEPIQIGDRSMTAEQWLREIGATGPLVDGDNKIRVEALESFRDGLRTQLQRINTGNEMDMLMLQNSMQQRSQVIQIGTNVMNSMHESAQGAIRNIGS